MKFIRLAAIAAVVVAISACAPRNDTQYYSIQEVLNSSKAKEVLDPNIKLYFGTPAPGEVVRAGATTSQRTNALNKTDAEACNWVFLSAVKRMQEGARRAGVTKVGNIVSNYNHKEFSSTTQFECHAGRTMAGVALKGDITK
ncbi:Excinuclease ATPase subunit [Bibersteinia trehalosi USDA-ARS-USMARC-188]|uniref:Excinuclease ATPase subunit n=3 Tax=Bibersteinia trehalosi TaxID=47735 RepID=A0A4V7I6Z5_BIBTR|nr:hypothetical protein [Bibersteinia trehalosi]AGH39464.1 Excinuclease ATPase subunit [Bibersteinia trehalosi USDA-ARS-USMARC-192]AHG80791.1 Excinuclease ATPase subunit [Bibersteinia trehalosi USDA-ARS-USMARC-188]AHG82940.1 Excinuclease ATPase subunit [Bibersteinia trehalosi USDA-ARS-USMARC-189]OAQ14030.1 excinuclease ABC subunit A [Bibersteinia trehalosi Y31]TCT16596.1 hypothetical protein EDC51_104148 [Bibersteinia trehalosi]